MLPSDVFIKATNAASVALASGFVETSMAFQEIALAVYQQMDQADRQSVWCDEASKLQTIEAVESVEFSHAAGLL